MDLKQDNPILSPIHQALEIFLRDNDPVEVSRTLRMIFFDFLRSRHEELPINFEEMLNHLENLFELLDDLADAKQE